MKIEKIILENFAAIKNAQSANKIEIDFSKRKNILFVGGFRHQPNVDAVLWFAENENLNLEWKFH